MNDQDDTEPTGRPDACAECADPGEGADDTLLDEPEGPDDTNAFLRWLPTMWLGHRRGKELVERPSSDGANFAAYACEGRPAPASMRLRPEATVQVQPSPAAGSRPPARRGVAYDSGSREHDAPTVVTRRRTAGARAALFGWGAAGLLAMSALILWWAHRPPATDLPVGANAAVTLPLPTARTRAERVEPSASSPLTVGLPEEAQMANAPIAPVAQRAMASAPLVKAVKEARRKGERGSLASVDGSTRASPSVAAPPVPVKEQYFEDP